MTHLTRDFIENFYWQLVTVLVIAYYHTHLIIKWRGHIIPRNFKTCSFIQGHSLNEYKIIMMNSYV